MKGKKKNPEEEKKEEETTTTDITEDATAAVEADSETHHVGQVKKSEK